MGKCRYGQRANCARACGSAAQPPRKIRYSASARLVRSCPPEHLATKGCGAALFYSGVIIVEAFAPSAGRLRRILAMAAFAPVMAAGLDVIENALHVTML